MPTSGLVFNNTYNTAVTSRPFHYRLRQQFSLLQNKWL